MFVLNNLDKRIRTNNNSNSYQYYDDKKDISLKKMQTRLNARGGTDQWTRMREDKLKGLKKALLYSYQSAVVQKYDVQKQAIIKQIQLVILKMQNQEQFDDNDKDFLKELNQNYPFLEDNNEENFIFDIEDLKNIIKKIRDIQPLFRCLINHDKLKVDYEDKIISIPFFEPQIGGVDPIETNFHNGTVFKWVHGNKQEWTPDTYWIVYMQYSEETAYFRAEIRKADQEIEIITIDEEGNENSITYRGWMTGPNETSALWNVKKGVAWNDMNYTKLLYITKDENTLAFFDRFDRIIINGKPWEVQAYNQNYSVSKNSNAEAGIIRVALKETYTGTDQFIKETLQKKQQEKEKQKEYQESHLQAYIEGTTIARPFDVLTYSAINFEQEPLKEWSISNSKLAKIIKTSENGKSIKVEIITNFSNEEGFYINYGTSEDTKLKVIIKSL